MATGGVFAGPWRALVGRSTSWSEGCVCHGMDAGVCDPGRRFGDPLLDTLCCVRSVPCERYAEVFV